MLGPLGRPGWAAPSRWLPVAVFQLSARRSWSGPYWWSSFLSPHTARPHTYPHKCRLTQAGQSVLCLLPVRWNLELALQHCQRLLQCCHWSRFSFRLDWSLCSIPFRNMQNSTGLPLMSLLRLLRSGRVQHYLSRLQTDRDLQTIEVALPFVAIRTSAARSRDS